MAPSRFIEVLEPRIAPALVFLNSSTVTYTDVDGDLVTIKSSKPMNNIVFFVTRPDGPLGGELLTSIEIGGAAGDSPALSLTITAKPQDVDGDGSKEGDGFANVGQISAAGVDLMDITIDGDLGKITVGDNNLSTRALRNLTVQSLGAEGVTTDAPDLNSLITGSLGKLNVAGNISEAFVRISGDLGSGKIGGSILGGSLDNSGQIYAEETLGPVTIRGNVAGGLGAFSGAIGAGGEVRAITIGGSLIGGLGASSGKLYSGFLGMADMGPVKIGRDVVGGDANVFNTALEAGTILANGDLESLRIGGSLIGKSAALSGRVHVLGTLGPTVIGGSVIGGEQSASGQLETNGIVSLSIGGSILGGGGNGAGAILNNGRIGVLTIGGDIIGGHDDHNTGVVISDSITKLTLRGSLIGGIDTNAADGLLNAQGSGAIAADTIGSLTIQGDILGSNSPQTGYILSNDGFSKIRIGGSLVGGSGNMSGMIEARGFINSISIGGDIRGGVSDANLTDSGTIQAVSIGSLLVGGSIIAGEETGAGENLRTGSVHASDSIGSITVKGSLIGSPGEPVFITARGQANPTNTSDVALKSLTVGGNVTFANIQLGYDRDSRGLNADAQVGAVRVHGDWQASSLIAGIFQGLDGWVGTTDDLKLFGDFGAGLVKDASPISRIASILIDGQVRGQNDFTSAFGFGAEWVQSMKVHGSTIRLSPGPSNDLLFSAATVRPVSSSMTVLTPDGIAVHVFEV